MAQGASNSLRLLAADLPVSATADRAGPMSLLLPKAEPAPVIGRPIDDAEPVDYLVPEPDETGAGAQSADAGPTPAAIRAGMRAAEAILAALIAAPPFQALLDELYALPSSDRPGFVRDELMNGFGVLERGIRLPDNVAFRAGRAGEATLFSLVCRLPEALQVPWQNAVVAFGHDGPVAVPGSVRT